MHTLREGEGDRKKNPLKLNPPTHFLKKKKTNKRKTTKNGKHKRKKKKRSITQPPTYHSLLPSSLPLLPSPLLKNPPTKSS